MTATNANGWSRVLFCVASSFIVACGCTRSPTGKPNTTTTYLSQATKVRIWFGTYGTKDRGREVGEGDYDTRQILGWLQESQWLPDTGKKWHRRGVDELWRIDVYQDRKLIGQIGVMPLRYGHRFYDIETHRFFENDKWEDFLHTLVERNPTSWKADVDDEYLPIGGYGPRRN